MKIQANFIHLYKHAASIWCAIMNSEKSLSNNKKLQIKCSRCTRSWWYSGLNPYYATCTFCKTSVNIRKNNVQVGNVVDQANSSLSEQTCEGDPYST
jgi:acetyl-CoA carboxylase beta subunit